MVMTKHSPKIYVALDTGDHSKVMDLAARLSGMPVGLKLGLTYFTAQGPQGVAAVRKAHPDTSIFLDLKLHDIPAQVEGAVVSVAALGVQYLTLHASGGAEMVSYARSAVDKTGTDLKLLSVTVLTSMNDELLRGVGQSTPIADQVARLGALAVSSGSHGLVCSPLEIKTLRADLGNDVVLMVPGIRPAEASVSNDDQKRVMTPKDALAAGATHLVIGRPITGAADPAMAAQAILESL